MPRAAPVTIAILPSNNFIVSYLGEQKYRNEVGNRKPEVRGRRPEVGSQRSEAGNKKYEVQSLRRLIVLRPEQLKLQTSDLRPQTSEKVSLQYTFCHCLTGELYAARPAFPCFLTRS